MTSHMDRTDFQRVKIASWRTVIISTLVSLVMVGLFQGIGIASRKGWMPFGFRYRLTGDKGSEAGTLKRIDQGELASVLKKHPSPRSIVFFSDLFANKPGIVYLHVNRPEALALWVNGFPAVLGSQKYHNVVRVKRGFNRLVIHYSPAHPDPADLHVRFSENMTIVPFPFFRLVWPGTPFSLPRIVFFIVWLLDNLKSVGFLVAFFLIVFRFFRNFPTLQPGGSGRPRFIFFLGLQFVVTLVACQLLLFFLLDILKVRFVPWMVWGIPLSLSVIFLWIDRGKSALTWRMNWKAAGMLLIFSLVVLSYVFLASGEILPLEPIGYGDLVLQLPKIKNIQFQGRFLDEDAWHVYPQSIHALIVSWGNSLKLEPEEFLTLFMMATMIGLFFFVYLLGSTQIPGIPAGIWLLAAAMAYFSHIFSHMFHDCSFPAIASVAIFFASMVLMTRGSSICTAVALASSLVVYPYFAFPFLAGFFLFKLGSGSEITLRSLRNALVGLVPAVAVLALYLWRFLSFGFAQHKEGFFTAFFLNPFLSLKFWNTVLVLLGMVVLFSVDRSRPILSLWVGLTIGFMANYLHYILFSSVSTYYVMKNMLFLIPAGTIFAAVGMSFLGRRFLRHRGFVLLIFVAGLGGFVFSHFQATKPFRQNIFLGVPATNRWILSHTPVNASIDVVAGNPDLEALFSLTLGYHRQLIYRTGTEGDALGGSRWLVVNRRLFPSLGDSPRWQKIYERSDIVVCVPR